MPSIIGFDIGSKRTGVARAPLDVSLASPLTTLDSGSLSDDTLQELLDNEQAVALVLGLPRGLEGQDTAQTNAVRERAHHYEEVLDVPVFLQDEAVTSIKAKEALRQNGRTYEKKDIDALAASYILQDFLDNQKETVSQLRKQYETR